MSSQKPKKRRILKVQVSFEVSRMSDECLASAYLEVLPVVARASLIGSQPTPKQKQPIRETLEDTSCFDGSDFGYCDSVTNS